jgi:hypothetical protein
MRRSIAFVIAVAPFLFVASGVSARYTVKRCYRECNEWLLPRDRLP